MDWPSFLILVRELRGIMNALCFVLILYGAAAVIRAARRCDR